MKQKFALIVLLIALLQLNGFGQNQTITMPGFFPMVVQDDITSVTASENINLILIQASQGNVGAKAPANVISKLKASFIDGNLIFASAESLKRNERLTVYVWVNNLEQLILNGNAFATCQGILKNKSLHVSAAAGAMFSIKSKGKVWFDTPTKYMIANEDGYFFVNKL